MLGVFLNNDLSFNTHIFSFGEKSRQVCNLLIYAYSGLNNNILISLYKVYVIQVSFRFYLNYILTLLYVFN